MSFPNNRTVVSRRQNRKFVCTTFYTNHHPFYKTRTRQRVVVLVLGGFSYCTTIPVDEVLDGVEVLEVLLSVVDVLQNMISLC